MDVRVACRCGSTMAWTAGLREWISQREAEGRYGEAKRRERGKTKGGEGKGDT